MRRIAALLVASVLLFGCDEGFVKFPVTQEAQAAIEEDVEIIRLDAGNIAAFTRPMRQPRATTLPAGRAWDYTVGVGDILSIIVFDHPELTLPAGPQRSAEESGFRVQADGTFFYPFIGQVAALGRRPEEIREDVRLRLEAFIPSPQVEVRVAAFNSQSITVTGEVGRPDRLALTTVPLTLIEAVNAAGGFRDSADPGRVTVQRGTTLYHVDVDGFLKAGIRQNNPVLRAGDVVTVPRRRTEEAYLLGEVRRQATIDLSLEPVTLTQALARQGGLNEVRADARGVFVFRSSGPRMRVFQLETSSPTGLLLGTRFVLEPQDVVYVTRSPLQRWNDTISALLPTIRAATAVESLVE